MSTNIFQTFYIYFYYPAIYVQYLYISVTFLLHHCCMSPFYCDITNFCNSSIYLCITMFVVNISKTTCVTLEIISRHNLIIKYRHLLTICMLIKFYACTIINSPYIYILYPFMVILITF